MKFRFHRRLPAGDLARSLTETAEGRDALNAEVARVDEEAALWNYSVVFVAQLLNAALNESPYVEGRRERMAAALIALAENATDSGFETLGFLAMITHQGVNIAFDDVLPAFLSLPNPGSVSNERQPVTKERADLTDGSASQTQLSSIIRHAARSVSKEYRVSTTQVQNEIADLFGRAQRLLDENTDDFRDSVSIIATRPGRPYESIDLGQAAALSVGVEASGLDGRSLPPLGPNS